MTADPSSPRSPRPGGSDRPPRRPPRQARAKQTRAHVLAAAAELFAEQGFSNTSIADVADRVGVTKGAVYFHFRDKTEMAVEVVRELDKRWWALVDDASSESLPPLATVRALLDRAAQSFFDDDVVKAGARLTAERSVTETGRPEPYLVWISTLSTMLAQARGAGELRADQDVESLAHILVSTFLGTQSVSDALQRRKDLPLRWAQVADLLFTAIAAGTA